MTGDIDHGIVVKDKNTWIHVNLQANHVSKSLVKESKAYLGASVMLFSVSTSKGLAIVLLGSLVPVLT